jgi:hypothetical protein
MAKPDVVGPWERHHKLTRILYQSEAQMQNAYISTEMEFKMQFTDKKTLTSGNFRDCTYSRADQRLQ